jgi:hypothetical protein
MTVVNLSNPAQLGAEKLIRVSKLSYIVITAGMRLCWFKPSGEEERKQVISSLCYHGRAVRTFLLGLF